MNDQINKIITKHVHTYCNSDINYHSVQGVVPAADELTALMCYREAYRIYTCMIRVFHSKAVADYMHAELSKIYDKETVQGAIEQVKKEMK